MADNPLSRLAPRVVQGGIKSVSRLLDREPMHTVRLSVLGFSRNNGLLWASALTYTTGLSIVPMLALALSALSGFGGVEKIRPLIEKFITPNSPELANRLMGLVSNVNARALGEVGAASLLVTVILTLGAVEGAFNVIFHAPRARTLLRKFSDYLSVTFTVPLLLVAALAVQARLSSGLPEFVGAGRLSATLMAFVAFGFLYMFFPNTAVRWRCALVGAFAAAILLQIAQWGFVQFQFEMIRYRAFYGALAAIPILLTWIYMNWAIVLFGGEIAAALQHGDSYYVGIDYQSPTSIRTVALLAALRLGERMLGRRGAVTVESLSRELAVEPALVRPVVERLKSAGLVVESAPDNAEEECRGLFLGRDSSRISVADVLACVDADGKVSVDQRLLALIDGLNRVERETFGSVTLRDLIAQ
jgi:membrane protein